MNKSLYCLSENFGSGDYFYFGFVLVVYWILIYLVFIVFYK